MNSIDDYMNRRRQAIQEALEAREAQSQAQIGLTQAKAEAETGQAGSSFSNRLKEEGNKMQADMMTDISSAGLAPTILKGAARLATARAGQLSTRWKTVQARRYAEQEGLNPDEAAPENEGTFRGMANDAVDNLRQNAGEALDNITGRAGELYQNLSGQARNALNNLRQTGQVEADEQFRFENPAFEEPEMLDAGTTGLQIPEGAEGNITRIGQMLRNIRGAPAGSTSQNIGDVINQIRPSEQARQPNLPDETATQREIMDRDPEDLQGEAPQMQRIPEPQEPQMPQPEEAPRAPEPEYDPLDITEEEAGTLFDKPPAVSVVGAIPEQQQATAEAAHIAEKVEGDAGQITSDLAPEITAASEGWSSLASSLGDAIPFVGFGLGAWALGEGIADEVKNIKDSSMDPYASVRPELAKAQQQINNLQANVSADEFASKIGAGTPSFGSIASRPSIDTSQMSGIALHV